MGVWFAFRPAATAPEAAPATGSGAPSGAPASPTSAAATPPTAAAPEVVTLPATVATTKEMAKPWSFKRFIVRQAGDRMPAMLLRIPAGPAGAASGYWAFLLKASYAPCELELITDLKKLADEYGHPARNPMVVEPCTQTLFNPLSYGPIGANTYARGEVVRGTALRPPVMIDIRVQKGEVIAVRTE